MPTLVMMTYHLLAFNSPWVLGYFYHAYPEFAEVHNRDNPLGLVLPDQFWNKLSSLFWGRYRGLLFYAPIMWLAVPGWLVLCARRQLILAVGTFSIVAAIVLVNVCYPEWTGGWLTGPRLLVPLLPFAMLPVAALIAGDSAAARAAALLAAFLGLAGGVLMLLFQGADGRIPHDIADPLTQAVWPVWRGQAPPGSHFHLGFCRTIVSVLAPSWIAKLEPRNEALQFLPLVLVQVVAIAALSRAYCSSARPAKASSDLGVDHE